MWFIMAWQRISAQVILEGFKKCCISNAADKTDDAIPWNGSLGVSVRKKKALTVKMETVTSTGKGRYDTLCVLSV